MVSLVGGSSAVQIDNILVEDKCVNDCRPISRFQKGIAARSFARAVLFAPCATQTLRTMLEASAKGAASACEGTDDIQCEFTWLDGGAEWNSLGATASDGNLAELFNSLEVVQGLLYPLAKGLRNVNGTITGGHCSGDPTQNKDVSSTSDAGTPEKTGTASTVAASITAALAVAFAAALSF
jgi:mannan endo-1,6-alpha-mannosidase